MTPQLRFPEFTDEWQVKKIGDTGNVITGSTPITADRTLYGSEYQFISPGDMNSGRYVISTKQRLSQKGFDISRKIKTGSTLFVCIGSTIGKTAQVREMSVTNQQINAVVTNDNHDDDFVYLALSKISTKIALSAGAQAVPIISKSDFSKNIIHIPSKPEQEKIADFLTAVDERIGVSEKKLELLETYKRGVMQKIFSQQIRFKDENGNEYPEWSNGILGHLINISMGQSPSSSAYNDSGDGIPLIQGNADIKNRRSKPRFWTTEVTKTCDRGDIILTVRAPSGYVALSSHQACIGRGVCAIKASGNSLIEYLYQYLLWFEPKWISVEQGSTFTAISGEDIKGLKVKIPRLEEQQKIADFLTTLDTRITTEKSKLTATRQFKKALLQKMFV